MGGGDSRRKGWSLRDFSRGEGGRAESSRRKGGDEVMEGGRMGARVGKKGRVGKREEGQWKG